MLQSKTILHACDRKLVSYVLLVEMLQVINVVGKMKHLLLFLLPEERRTSLSASHCFLMAAMQAFLTPFQSVAATCPHCS